MIRKKRTNCMKEKDVLVRADLNFKKEIDDIIRQRISLGKENPLKPKGTRRITKAIRRHSKWIDIKQDIVLADLD